MPVVKGKHYPYTPEGKAQAKEAAGTKYGSATQFGKTSGGTGGGGGGGIMSMLGGLGGGDKKESKPKGEPTYNYRTGETSVIQFKSPSAFKLRSGNTTPFKMMGSSPAKFWGGMFGGGGGGGMFGGGMFGGGGGAGGWFAEKRKERKKKRMQQMWNRMPEGAHKKKMFGKWSTRYGIVDPAAAAAGATGGGTVPPHGDEAHTGGGTPIGGTGAEGAGTEELPADAVSEDMEMPEGGADEEMV